MLIEKVKIYNGSTSRQGNVFLSINQTNPKDVFIIFIWNVYKHFMVYIVNFILLEEVRRVEKRGKDFIGDNSQTRDRKVKWKTYSHKYKHTCIYTKT